VSGQCKQDEPWKNATGRQGAHAQSSSSTSRKPGMRGRIPLWGLSYYQVLGLVCDRVGVHCSRSDKPPQWARARPKLVGNGLLGQGPLRPQERRSAFVFEKLPGPVSFVSYHFFQYERRQG